jgi:low affinity Fe/Cu permease
MIHILMSRLGYTRDGARRDEPFTPSGKGLFFTISVVVVAIWMPTIFVFHDIDTWQLVINTLTSVLAFLLIALLQNSGRRYDEALHQKIDALAAALADLMEHQANGDRELLERHIEELRSSVGLEREL